MPDESADIISSGDIGVRITIDDVSVFVLSDEPADTVFPFDEFRFYAELI